MSLGPSSPPIYCSTIMYVPGKLDCNRVDNSGMVVLASLLDVRGSVSASQVVCTVGVLVGTYPGVLEVGTIVGVADVGEEVGEYEEGEADIDTLVGTIVGAAHVGEVVDVMVGGKVRASVG